MPRANRGPHVAPGPAGRYEIRWTDNGRSRRRSTGTSDFQSAQKILANFILLGEREAVREARADVLMVRDAIGDPDLPGADYWHEHVEPNVVDKESARYARTKLIAHFGHLAVKDIEPADVDAYVAARRAGRLGRPSVNHTISRELSVLNAAINHAVKKKRLSKQDRPFIALPGASVPRDRWLSEEEADRLLAAALKSPPARKGRLPRVYLFVALALNTASRKSALLEMTWEQVRFDDGLIYLNPAGRRQTNKRRPRVPISDELMPILRRADEESRGTGGKRLSEFVLGRGGSIRTAFENAVARAGLGRDVTPHVLRHTWATWAAQAGTSMFDIAGVLGDTVDTVTRTYAHHHPDYLRAAVNNVRPSARKKKTDALPILAAAEGVACQECNG